MVVGLWWLLFGDWLRGEVSEAGDRAPQGLMGDEALSSAVLVVAVIGR